MPTPIDQPSKMAVSRIEAHLEGSAARQIDTLDGLATKPAISAQERRRRAEAVRFADASMALEGFTVSAEAQVSADRFIAGEIDIADFLRGA